jgi:hypothetical protein
MEAGLRLAARGRMASLLGEAEGAEVASRRLKRAVLAGQPDVNRSPPSSIGRVASSSERAAVACVPFAPVALPGVEWRPLHLDGTLGTTRCKWSRGHRRGGWLPVGREPLIATVPRVLWPHESRQLFSSAIEQPQLCSRLR